jgi:hypothetical protein
MLTGELPGKTIEPPSKKVSIDVRLDEVVLRALEKKPELRYQQASVLKTQVETISQTTGGGGCESVPPDFIGASETSGGGKPAARKQTLNGWDIASAGFFLLTYLGMLLLMAVTGGGLPHRIASHFGAQGQANGWMERGSYLVFLGCVPWLFVGLAFFVSWMILHGDGRFINIPRKDHWLTPERRPEVAAFLRRRMFWLAGLMTGFFTGLHLLTVQANQCVPPRLSMGGLLALVMVLLVAVLIWMTGLLSRLAEVHRPLNPTAGDDQRAATVEKGNAPSKNESHFPMVFMAGVHGLAVLGLLAFLVFGVPRFIRVFADFEAELPISTQVLIQLAGFMRHGGFLLVPVLLAADAAVCWLLHRFATRKLLAAWTALVLLGVVTVAALSAVSLYLPMSRLAHVESNIAPLPAGEQQSRVRIPARSLADLSRQEQTQALKLFNDIEDFGQEFDAAFTSRNLVAAKTGVRRLRDMLVGFNITVQGTGNQLPPDLFAAITKLEAALESGDWEKIRQASAHNEAFSREFKRIGTNMAALAAQIGAPAERAEANKDKN